jgi:hypothetical protein
MMTIADNRHFSYQNQDDLVSFIASEMQKEATFFVVIRTTELATINVQTQQKI